MNSVLTTLGVFVLAGLVIYFLLKGRRRNIRMEEFQRKKIEHMKEIEEVNKELEDGVKKLYKARRDYQDLRRLARKRITGYRSNK